MNKIKNLLDNPMYKKLLIISSIILIVVFIIIIISIIVDNKKYNYQEFETRMIDLAQNYYDTRKELLPTSETDITVLSVDTLVNQDIIKPLGKILKNGNLCNGEIEIINNNGYYLYIPKLDCGTYYQSKSLSEVLLNEKNIVTSGNGIYNTENGYIYKGDSVNNYLKINEDIWRIIKINNDGSIKALNTAKTSSYPWDNRYNIEKKSSYGINDFITENINSRIKDALEEIYNKYDDNTKSYFMNQILCIGKRNKDETINNGSIECSNTIEKQQLGLIQVNEYLNASLDPNCLSINNSSCINYNYLKDVGNTWTITADASTTYKSYRLNSGNISLTNSSSRSQLKVVALLSSKLLYNSGSGTETDPYTFK